ncbi:MAG: hypothetical protein M3Z36_11520, partial [Acidobacteriota bacterium]|nr:hypothetical protein [Acidobacteriota bacterium]
LKTDPDWSALPAATPAPIRKLLCRCLQRDRKRRLRDIADARLEIDEALSAPAEAPAVLVPTRSHSRVHTVAPWAIAALVSTAWFGFSFWRTAPPDPSSFKVLLPPPEKTAFTPVEPNTGGVSVSPDGRSLAFVATQDGRTLLWIRRLDSLDARTLPRTDNAYFPFWSPDSRFLGFFAEGKLKKIELGGGAPQIICEVTGLGRGATWNREGVIVFGVNGLGLQRVSAAGGQPVEISVVDQYGSHFWPYFLPDGKHFLYLAWSILPDKSAIRVASLDAKPGVDEPIELLKAGSNGIYAPLLGGRIGLRRGGWLLFHRNTTLFAQRFDVGRLKLQGEAVPIAEGVVTLVNVMFANTSVSENGVLVYGQDGSESSRLIWIGRDGRSTPVKAAMAAYFMPRLSPDGSKVAVSVAESQTGSSNIWQMDLVRGTSTRFTFGVSPDVFPLWSPDGKRIVFGSSRGGTQNLFLKASNGSGDEERITPPLAGQRYAPYDWSRDGRYILFTRRGATTGPDLWIFNLNDRQSVPFLNTKFTESQGQFSPDVRWVAYSSDASGRYEIYVRSFTGTAQFLVSNDGGAQPRWRGDGKELYYIGPDGKMMAVNAEGGGETFTYDTPRLLFEIRALIGAGGSTPEGYRYDVTRDGQRFVVLEKGDAGAQPFILVTNWQAGLRK